jgi:hypothetical protein
LLIGEHIRKDTEDVKQVAFIGVTNPLDHRLESPASIRDALVEAAKYIPVDQLVAANDCGFLMFSIDVKPKHGSQDFAQEVVRSKFRIRLENVRLASEVLGV